MHPPSTHVFLRPVGSPLRIGMAGLLLASLVQSGLDLGWVPPSETADVGLILIAAPFVLQLVASVFSYLARDGATAAAIGVLATTWLALGLIHLAFPPGAVDAGLGLLLLSAGTVLGLSSLAVASLKPLPALVFLAAALRFIFAAIYELSAVGFWQDVAGVIGLLTTVLAAYCVLAFELEGLHNEPVLPTFRRRQARSGTDHRLADQLDAIAREPGVRETT